MLISRLLNRKRWVCWGLFLAGALATGGCQSLTTSVDAIMRHDAPPRLSLKQRKAYSAFDAGQFSQAVGLFQDAIAIESDKALKAMLYNGLGSSHNELEQQSEAIAAYEASLKLVPDNAQVWVNLGIAQRLHGAYEDALQSYEKALALDDSLATAHSSIGSLRVLQGQPQLAIASFQSAIDLDANLAVTHGNLALAHAMVENFEEAQQSLKRAVALGYENGNLIQARIDELRKLQ